MLLPRTGPRPLVAAGMLIAAAGMAPNYHSRRRDFQLSIAIMPESPASNAGWRTGPGADARSCPPGGYRLKENVTILSGPVKAR